MCSVFMICEIVRFFLANARKQSLSDVCANSGKHSSKTIKPESDSASV